MFDSCDTESLSNIFGNDISFLIGLRIFFYFTRTAKFQRLAMLKIGILLSKLFWPTVRKKCSSDREKLLKFEAEGWEYANSLRLLERFILEKAGTKTT